MQRSSVTAKDLVTAAETAHQTLSGLTEAQWDEKPPHMTWTRLITASHICGALLFYATQLANRSGAYIQTVQPDESVMKGENMPALVKAQAGLLAAVAQGVPPEIRAWHPAGSPDPEGFLAMGTVETLLHCWDTTEGMDLTFAGDEGIAGRLLRRLFPWAPKETPRWQTLLFATGRGGLPGYESPGERWMWHNAPLDEWDGKERRSDMWAK